jgi:hypothetical protein
LAKAMVGVVFGESSAREFKQSYDNSINNGSILAALVSPGRRS